MMSDTGARFSTHRRTARPSYVRLWAWAVLLASASQAHSQTWPTITVPQGVETFDMGGQITNNGLPIQVRGLLSEAGPALVASRFRASMGQPLVESTLASKLVLGKALGEFYVTVQVEPAGAGTRGFIAVAKLSAAPAARASIRLSNVELQAHFLPGTTLLSKTDTVDGGKHAALLVLRNDHDIDLNIRQLKKALGSDGLSLEREEKSTTSNPRVPRDGKALFFKGTKEEAVAVVYRDGAGAGTAIVLNTIGYPERAK